MAIVGGSRAQKEVGIAVGRPIAKTLLENVEIRLVLYEAIKRAETGGKLRASFLVIVRSRESVRYACRFSAIHFCQPSIKGLAIEYFVHRLLGGFHFCFGEYVGNDDIAVAMKLIELCLGQTHSPILCSRGLINRHLNLSIQRFDMPP